MTEFSVGEFLTGSASLESASSISPNAEEALRPAPAEVHPVTLEMSDGFSKQEGSADAHVRWSEGPSGEGAIVLWNHTGHSLRTEFTASLATGQSEESSCEVRFRGEATVYEISSQLRRISRVLELLPGKNLLQIKSDAARAPWSKSRYLVFCVSGLT